MTRALIIILLTICIQPTLSAQTDFCANFETLVKSTYTFKPSLLTEAQQTEKSAAMDRVWKMAESNPRQSAPCLLSLLKADPVNSFFRFDGSNLLVAVDNSRESKQFQVDSYGTTPLSEVDQRYWVSVLALRGSEGFNTSKAALHWLSYRNGRYFLPEHGGYLMNHGAAALIIFGSMDESFAGPALLSIASNRNDPAREIAVGILLSQATPESLKGLARIDTSTLSAKTKLQLRKLLTQPELLRPRTNPRTTREEFIRAFEKLVNGNPRDFFDLVDKVPDGEKDVVAVLRTEDIPLVRRVRRMMIRNGNQHAIEFYHSFTAILLTLVWKPELVQ